MFTADKARATSTNAFDRRIETLVREAWPACRTYYKINWGDGDTVAQEHQVAEMLRERGFVVNELVARLRYVEVHFSWEPTTDGTDAR